MVNTFAERLHPYSWATRIYLSNGSWLNQAEALLQAFSERCLRRGSWQGRDLMLQHICASRVRRAQPLLTQPKATLAPLGDTLTAHQRWHGLQMLLAMANRVRQGVTDTPLGRVSDVSGCLPRHGRSVYPHSPGFRLPRLTLGTSTGHGRKICQCPVAFIIK